MIAKEKFLSPAPGMTDGFGGPVSLSGHPLAGDAPVRFIYTDEAGTSVTEKVTVVAALIVHADTQWQKAANLINGLKAYVPTHYRDGFVFHATSIWGNRKFRDGWSREERKAFLMAMMRIPRASGIALSYGIFYRDGDVKDEYQALGMTREQYQHAESFAACMCAADEYVCKYAGKEELATVVAEDIPEMRDQLRNAAERMRIGSSVLSNARIEVTNRGKVESVTRDATFKIRRIVDAIHFTPKASAPLLQVADAVAFGLRRYFSEESEGVDFGKAVIGEDMNLLKRTIGMVLTQMPIAIET